MPFFQSEPYTWDRVKEFFTTGEYEPTDPYDLSGKVNTATNKVLDMIENAGDSVIRGNPYAFNAAVNALPISATEKAALKAAYGMVTSKSLRQRSGPRVTKRTTMPYGTRRKRSYYPRRRAYSKKARSVYRKKPVSKKRNASAATMNLIWKAMKSRM